MTSSLRELDRIEDRIRQHRQVVQDPVLLVEGPDDKLVLSRHIVATQLFPADGKVNLLRALRALAAWSEPDVLGVVDRDFDDADAVADLAAELVPFDGRDMEMMMIKLGVLEDVLEHMGSSSKIAAAGGTKALVDRSVRAVEPIAAVRAKNATDSIGLDFDEVKISSKVDRRTLDLALEGYLRALLAKSGHPISLADLQDAIAAHVDDGHGPRGKDVAAVAGVALRHIAGTLPLAATDESLVISQIHAAAGQRLARSDWMARLLARLPQSMRL